MLNYARAEFYYSQIPSLWVLILKLEKAKLRHSPTQEQVSAYLMSLSEATLAASR